MPPPPAPPPPSPPPPPQMNLILAIDYTGSNRDPRLPESLHYIHVPCNEYMSALQSVGAILLEYDHDKSVPMFGFGGAINSVTSHCFPLTFNDAAPEVHGMDGMVRAYVNSFQYVGLSGPTIFEAVIRRATSMALHTASTPGALSYTVMLLITECVRGGGGGGGWARMGRCGG